MSLFETESYEIPRYIDPFSLFGPEAIMDTIKRSAELDDNETIKLLQKRFGDNYLNDICAGDFEPPTEAEVNA